MEIKDIKNKRLKGGSATQPGYTSGDGEVARPAGLQRRGSSYSYRRRVPDELRLILNKRELVVALGTTNYQEACIAARRAAVQADERFATARRQLVTGEPVQLTARVLVTDAELQRVAMQALWKAERSTQAISATPAGVSETAWIDGLHHDLASMQAADGNALPVLFQYARRVVEEHRLQIDLPTPPKLGVAAPSVPQPPDQPRPELRQLIEYLRRAEIERLKRLLDRAEGGHGEHAFDPLFDGITARTPAVAFQQRTMPSLGDAVERFEKDPTRAHLTASAGMKYRLTFRAMTEVIDKDRPLNNIHRQDCVAAQELLARLPPNFVKMRRYKRLATLKEVADRAAEYAERPIAAGTLKVYTHSMSAFFNWAVDRGLISTNPAARLRVPSTPAKDKKDPFTVDELQQIVAGLEEWATASGNPRGGRFWIPLIALFTGMRLGEIAYLKTSDIRLYDGIHIFALRYAEDRSLKNENAERTLPMHPLLEELGLIDLWQKAAANKQERLFPDVTGIDQDQVSDRFSKRFTYWLKSQLRIKRKGISFHSFRHTFRDALREAEVPTDATRALGGWARGGGVEERYGSGLSLKSMARAIAKVSYPGVDFDQLKR